MILTSVFSTVFLLPYVSAFPSYADPGPMPEILKGRRVLFGPVDLKGRQIPFDPVAQKIDVSGKHAFIPPGPKDLRGPCPALNALANHGYLARSGVTSLLEAIPPCQNVFGLSLEFCTAICAYGVVSGGNPITQKWSIGGPPPQTLLEKLTSVLFNPPQGLSGTHNFYESDSSAIMGDKYLFSGDSMPRLEYIQQLLDGSNGVDDYSDKSIWRAHRATRFKHSIKNNPQFFFAPISGIVTSGAGFTLPPAVFSSRSSAEPDKGVLTRSVLLSFYGVSEGPAGQLIINFGHERIPENWYRRSPLQPYTIVDFFSDIVAIILSYPPAGRIGGNTGTTDSFVGLGLGDLTGGVYHAADLTDPTKLSCFIYSASLILTPPILRDRFKNTLPALDLMGDWNKGFEVAGCPLLPAMNQTMFGQFPGATGNIF